MVSKNIILAKSSTINRCLSRIEEKLSSDPDLSEIDSQDVVILNLQRAIQAVLDICNHLISEKNLPLPNTNKDIILTLYNAKYFSRELCDRLTKMAGFRNISVHDYQTIDESILEAIVTKHLVDFKNFLKVVFEQEKL